MDDKTKEALLELISTLLFSCTQEYDDGVVQHEHNLFDNVDKDRLDKLYRSINGEIT